MNIININDLSHSYVFAQKEIKTLKNISLYINKGEYISIVGKNGYGKSTLVKHLNALIDIQHGEITIATLDCKNNKNIYKIRQKCGMVFQNPDNQFIGATVRDDIAFGLENICGSLKAGLPADFIVLDDSLELQATYIDGCKGWEK